MGTFFLVLWGLQGVFFLCTVLPSLEPISSSLTAEIHKWVIGGTLFNKGETTFFSLIFYITSHGIFK